MFVARRLARPGASTFVGFHVRNVGWRSRGDPAPPVEDLIVDWFQGWDAATNDDEEGFCTGGGVSLRVEAWGGIFTRSIRRGHMLPLVQVSNRARCLGGGPR